MAAALVERWQAWSVRFAALQAREKYLVVGAAAAVILLGGYTLWIEPGMLEAARLKKTLAQQQTEQDQLRVQLAALAAQANDPDAANRVALQQLREQLAAAERDLKGFDQTLVPPTQAPLLLQALLARHRGLSLVSLATLAPQPLIESPTKKEGEKTETAKMPGGNIYKHGLEIKLAGSYHDLLSYVAELEAGPQKLLWGDMRLAVKEHPLSELTLTVFTLSLDSTWLVV